MGTGTLGHWIIVVPWAVGCSTDSSTSPTKRSAPTDNCIPAASLYALCECLHVPLSPAPRNSSHLRTRHASMPSLAATYTSPTSPSQFFSARLPAISSPPSTADRVAYLEQLASSLKTLQDDVNIFLTQKMAQDKACDDTKAEETYGEEVADED